MVSRQSFVVVVRSAAPIERVFDLLADGAGWSRWAGPLVPTSSWEREGTPAPGGVGAIRRLGAGRIGSREEIVGYDRPAHLAYTLLSGQPVRGYRGDVDLTAEDDGGTRITWRGSFEPLVPGTGPAMRWWLATAVRSFARRLAAHAAREATP